MVRKRERTYSHLSGLADEEEATDLGVEELVKMAREGARRQAEIRKAEEGRKANRSWVQIYTEEPEMIVRQERSHTDIIEGQIMRELWQGTKLWTAIGERRDERHHQGKQRFRRGESTIRKLAKPSAGTYASSEVWYKRKWLCRENGIQIRRNLRRGYTRDVGMEGSTGRYLE
jgi:hypothetical protein